MKTLIKINQMLLRLLVLVMLVLGVMVWMGHAGVVNAHIGLGFIFTSLVLLQALFGAWARVGWGLVGMTVVWAVLLPVIGLGQRTFMPGGVHWAVQAFHLLFAVATLAFVERIGKRALTKPPAA